MPAGLADSHSALAGFRDFLGSATPRDGGAGGQQQTALRPVATLVAGQQGHLWTRVGFTGAARGRQCPTLAPVVTRPTALHGAS